MINLSEWAGAGDWRLLFIHRDRIAKIKADDVNRVAEKYLVSSNRTAGMFLPTEKPSRASVPEAPDVVALATAYKGGKAMAGARRSIRRPRTSKLTLKRVTSTA